MEYRGTSMAQNVFIVLRELEFGGCFRLGSSYSTRPGIEQMDEEATVGKKEASTESAETITSQPGWLPLGIPKEAKGVLETSLGGHLREARRILRIIWTLRHETCSSHKRILAQVGAGTATGTAERSNRP